MDGRHGTAKFGDSERNGFALMHDPDKRLIAFHALGDESDGRTPAEPFPRDQFVIAEDAFEPKAVLS